MKIFLLANANSIHTQRWAIGLAEKGLDIFLFSISQLEDKNLYKKIPNIELYEYGFLDNHTKYDGFGLSKIKYLNVLKSLKHKIKNFNPDILHAHYISGYGTLGMLSGFHPLVLSVWGSDIYDFPHKSFIHKKLIEYNLKKADKILSTSHIMKKEIQKYSDKEIEVTPFGIDLEVFKPMKVDSIFSKKDIIIGTIKTLEKEYGIEYLIRAFKLVIDNYPDLPLKLLIVGDGSLREKLYKLTEDLGIIEKAHFAGNVSHINIPKYHNMLSIAIFPSNNESFGVAVIEASATGKAVIVSNVGGLPEVVEKDVTGLIVAPKNEVQIAGAIEKLLFNKTLRFKMGKAGRERVKQLYHWDENLNQMITIYTKLRT
jgi:glycosyltransferase involved in cell wall biosynthesis